jgi:GT2 family glycosyltransferase
MKVAIIFLDYLRHQYSRQALVSIAKGNYPFDLFTIQEKGIAKALNIGIKKTMEYDAIVTCANDIEMDENWLLEMVSHAQAIPETGMCGIHCVEDKGSMTTINGKLISKTFTAFGNVLIPRKAIDTIGFFNEDYDPYGMQDADYAYRLNKKGFINYYIPHLSSNHIGHDVGQQTDYRKMKDEGLALSDEKWKRWTALYDEDENYIINQVQYEIK